MLGKCFIPARFIVSPEIVSFHESMDKLQKIMVGGSLETTDYAVC